MEPQKKKTKRGKALHPLCDAVRQLRQHMGMTQQAFAEHMKSAVRTITRYEGGHPPTGPALAKFAAVAAAIGRQDLAQLFNAARDMERPPGVFEYQMTIPLNTMDEAFLCRVFVEILRNDKYLEVRRALFEILSKTVETLAENMRLNVKLLETALTDVFLREETLLDPFAVMTTRRKAPEIIGVETPKRSK